MLFHPLNSTSWGSLQKEKYPLQAFLSYLNDPATTAQRLKIFLGLGLGPKKPKYCNTIIKNEKQFLTDVFAINISQMKPQTIQWQ